MAPSFNPQAGYFRDWNIDRKMTAAELRRIIKESGLSYHAWLLEHGFDGHGATRLRQMCAEQRTITDSIEAAAGESARPEEVI